MTEPAWIRTGWVWSEVMGPGHTGRMGRARAMPILKRRGGRMGIAPALPILRKKSSHKDTKTQR